MKKILMGAFFLIGIAALSYGQAPSPTAKDGVVKTKSNGVKTKQNKSTGDFKRKDETGKTKTDISPAKTKTDGTGLKHKKGRRTTKTKKAGQKKVTSTTINPGTTPGKAGEMMGNQPGVSKKVKKEGATTKKAVKSN